MNIYLTYFQKLHANADCRVYSIDDAKKWLKNDFGFYAVGVTEDGQTIASSAITNITDNTITSFNGINYKIVGIDSKRHKPTKVNVLSFIVNNCFSVPQDDVPKFVKLGLPVHAQFVDPSKNMLSSGDIMHIDLGNRQFVTKSDLVYSF